jgi:hypothetical protein
MFELLQRFGTIERQGDGSRGSAWTILCLGKTRGENRMFCLSAEPAIHKEVRNCSSTFYSASSEE